MRRFLGNNRPNLGTTDSGIRNFNGHIHAVNLPQGHSVDTKRTQALRAIVSVFGTVLLKCENLCIFRCELTLKMGLLDWKQTIYLQFGPFFPQIVFLWTRSRLKQGISLFGAAPGGVLADPVTSGGCYDSTLSCATRSDWCRSWITPSHR